MKRILWIEEETKDILSEYKTFLDNENYLLDVAPSPKEAEEFLKINNYDIIILDLRLLPGESEEWVRMHLDGEKRLCLMLLKKMLLNDSTLTKKIVIFSNEMLSEIRPELEKYGISTTKFLRKRNSKIPEELEEFILANTN